MRYSGKGYNWKTTLHLLYQLINHASETALESALFWQQIILGFFFYFLLSKIVEYFCFGKCGLRANIYKGILLASLVKKKSNV